MDPFSFALTIAGVPGIFKSCLDCFEYIRLSQNFGKDYAICVARLEAADVQFTRWGESMGLFQEPGTLEPPSFGENVWREEDVKKAKRWLALILSAFEDAKTISERYRLSWEDEEDTGALNVPNQNSELEKAEPRFKSLISSFRKIKSRRKQGSASFPKKTSWALYRKADFESLIGTVCRLVDNLVTLFPAAHAAQEKLYREEVAVIETEVMLTLVEIIGDNDKLLNREIANELDLRGHVFRNISVNGNGFTMVGNVYEDNTDINSKSTSFTNVYVSGSGRTHIGNHYGRATTGFLTGDAADGRFSGPFIAQ